jgi:hypothetical protein
MLNIISIDIWDVCLAGLFCVLLVVSAILIFKWMWVDQMVFDLPKGGYRSRNNDYGESLKIGSLGEYVSTMWLLLWDLDIPYWLDFIGLEGYSYVYFIRCMMTEMFTYFVFWGMFTLGIYLMIYMYTGTK